MCLCRQICACIFAKNSHSTCGVTPIRSEKLQLDVGRTRKAATQAYAPRKLFIFFLFSKKILLFRYCKVFCLHLRQKPSLFLLCLYFSVKKNTFFYFVSLLSRMHIFFPRSMKIISNFSLYLVFCLKFFVLSQNY